MTVVHDFEGWPRGPLHLAIGVFDGVHVGHHALVAAEAKRAHAESATPMAATFDPLPIEVLAPGAPPSALSDVDERTQHLLAAGAEAVAVFRFDREFASLTPDVHVPEPDVDFGADPPKVDGALDKAIERLAAPTKQAA